MKIALPSLRLHFENRCSKQMCLAESILHRQELGLGKIRMTFQGHTVAGFLPGSMGPLHPRECLSLPYAALLLLGRWNRIVELVEQRKEEVSAVLLVENHVLEVAEVRAQVREKRRAVESAPRVGGALQWRLSGLEAALQALEPRQAALLEEAALLAVRFPAQAARLHQGAEELGAEWGALASAAQACGEAVAAAGRLQRFLHDLDAFLDWLVRAQETAGGGEGPLPRSLEEADALLARHAALKEEVDQREEDYARIVAASEALLAGDGAELGPGLALDEWLPHLELGWHKLLGLWEARREALVQAHVYQLFLRDLRQARAVLRNQVPASGGWHGWGSEAAGDFGNRKLYGGVCLRGPLGSWRISCCGGRGGRVSGMNNWVCE